MCLRQYQRPRAKVDGPYRVQDDATHFWVHHHAISDAGILRGRPRTRGHKHSVTVKRCCENMVYVNIHFDDICGSPFYNGFIQRVMH